MRQARRASGVMAALLLAGCGTTVPLTAGSSSLGTSGNSLGSSLGVPGSNGAGSGGTTGSGPGSTGGLAVGGSGGSTAGGGSSAAAGGASGPGAVGGHVHSGGVSGASGPGGGPGVTATEIRIGLAYEPDASSADAALGAANLNPGDTKAENDAIINYLNGHGGFAGRRLVPVWYKGSVNNSASVNGQAACQQWTVDNKVLVLSGEGYAGMDNCAAHAGAVNLTSGAITLHTTATNRQFPMDINLNGLTNDRAMAYTVEGLQRQGYFGTGSTVGVATWDDPYFHYGVDHAVLPALARLGYRNVKVAYITSPQTYGDLGATSASVSNAVLRFHSAGINHVLLLDGGSGVNSAGILVLEWMHQAQSQSYFPKYGLNSTMGFNALAPDLPRQQMVGSEGVSWEPVLDTGATTGLSSRAKLCERVMANAGQKQSAANAVAVQLGICDQFFFLQQVLDAAHSQLDQASVLRVVDHLGTGYSTVLTFGIDLTAARHDGAYQVRNMAFNSQCSCYRYQGPVFAPSG